MIRLFTHRGQCFETFDLTADIHVMPLCANARFCHLAKRQHERTRAVQDRIHFHQSRVKRRGIFNGEGPIFQTEFFRLSAYLILIASRKQGLEASLYRLLHN